MIFIALATGSVLTGLFMLRSMKRQQADRLRDQAQLSAIEVQLAGLRAALRLSLAEHLTRKRMQERDVRNGR